MPVWDDPLHNKLRNVCFKILGSLCEQAVKHICDNDTQSANTDPEVDGNNNAMDVEDGSSSEVKVHQSGKELAQLKSRLVCLPRYVSLNMVKNILFLNGTPLLQRHVIMILLIQLYKVI